jgi:hypothetical protein
MINENANAGRPAERIEAPVPSTSKEVPHASVEADKGFDNFAGTKDAMMPKGNGGLHQVSIDGADNQGDRPATVQNAMVSPNRELGRAVDPQAERGRTAGGEQGQDGDKAEAETTEDSDPGEIKPTGTDRFKTPVINPNDVMTRKFDGSADRPRDELGNVTPEASKNFLGETHESATSQVGKDGKPTSIVSQHGDEKTTFGFNKDGSVSRTIEGPDGKEVVQFDKNGAPTSRKTSEHGEPLKTQKVNPDDKVAVTKNADGTTTIVSNSADADTTITLGKDGKPVDRKIERDDDSTATEFNKDGSPKVNTITNFDGDNKTVETTRKDGKRTESYEKDEVVSTRDEDQEYTTTNSVLKDGSLASSVEDNKGATLTIINGADGSTITHNTAPGITETTIENPDGSSTYSYEDSQKIQTQIIDKDGNWQKNHYNKFSGIAQRTSGARGEKEDATPVERSVPT